jgi:RHS repeat-associated protein
MNASTSLLSNIYGYDAMSRLASVGDGSRTVAYTRVPGSDALANTTLSNSSGTILTTNRTYDNHSRMTSIASTAGATTRSYAYVYNDKDQRSRCTLADGSYWLYSYDDKGQVIGGVKHDASGVAIPGMSFGYDYDGIGNRKQETRGMPEMLFSYSSNLVNQYTQRSIPGIVPVAGSAVSDSTVKVILPATGNIFDTSRNGAYYKAAIPVNNSSAGAETELTVIATKLDTDSNKDVINTISGKYYVPKTPQAFTYDPDGNMLTLSSDGVLWNLTWNGENRLIVAESAACRLEFTYDYMGRRVNKQVYTGSVGNWTLASESKYVYDGYYQIAEFDGSDNMLKSYLRVGGEIYAVTDTNQSATYFYMTDGNKNIMTLVDASGNVQADYTYDPFGRIIAKSGAYADTNAFRFSSEFYDTETNLVYYNYRYYSPDLGRWTKRDPIEEQGGSNLYGFTKNNSISKVDQLGLLFDILLDWRDRTKKTPILGPLNNLFYGGLWAVLNPHHVASAISDDIKQDKVSERVIAGVLATQNTMTFGADKYWLDFVGHPTYNQNFNDAYQNAQDGISSLFLAQLTSLGTRLLAGACIKVIPVKQIKSTEQLSRRDYLNQKFGRTGNLHGDINARSGVYPSGKGFISGTRELTELKTGMAIDRFGGFYQNAKFVDYGSYVSPAGASFNARSLPLVKQNGPYTVYKVLKPFNVEGGVIEPWFGQPGGGTQYLLPNSVENLVQQGYLKAIKRN